MSIEVSLLAGATSTGAGKPLAIDPRYFMRSLVAGVTQGAATVAMEVSNNNGITWAVRATLTLPNSSGALSDTDVDEKSPFPMVRGNVLSISGGAVVNFDISAS